MRPSALHVRRIWNSTLRVSLPALTSRGRCSPTELQAKVLLPGTHWHSSGEALDPWRTWDLVVCWPYFADHRRADAQWWQQLVHRLLRRAAVVAQRGKALGFISAGSELLDIRPDQYFPSLERMALIRKVASDCGCLTQIWPCRLEMTSRQYCGYQVCTFPHVPKI